MFRLLLLFALALPLSAQETMIRQVYDPVTDTHVEVLALFTRPSPSGYFPVRVKIANNLKKPSNVRLDFISNPHYSEDLRTTSSFDFQAAAGKTVVRDIMVPLSPQQEYNSNASVKATLSGSFGTASNTTSSSQGSRQPAVLLSETLFTPHASTLDSEISGKLSGSLNFAAKFDPKQLPDDWLAFSGYDCLIMTDGDWTKVPPGARNAVLSWVRLGGHLRIYHSGRTSFTAIGLPPETGFGQISTPELTSAPTFATELVATVLKSSAKPRQVSAESDYSAPWPLRESFGEQVYHHTFFVLVMICFGILVGPVNLFVFAKSGQRHRLFITTPIISLVASLVLVGLILTIDGFGGSGLRRVLMEVRPDAGVNAAYIHQEQFSRTGVLTAANFTIATPVIFQPVRISKTRLARFTVGNNTIGTFNLQPADGKLVATGDWFQSRSEHGQALSAVVSTRGRIERTEVANAFLSTFEFPIETLYYLDDAKQWHRADGIETGKKFTLTAIDASQARQALLAEAEQFAARNQEFLTTASGRPGHFIAITQAAPAIETHPGIRWKKTQTVVTGPVVDRS